MEFVFRISEPRFKDLLEKIPKEIARFLKLKEKTKKEYQKDKIKGYPSIIIKKLIELFNNKIKEGKFISDLKVNKIKRIWNSNELVLYFEYLVIDFNKNLEIELLESKKEKNYVVELKLRMS